jgi:hypothetical protein
MPCWAQILISSDTHQQVSLLYEAIVSSSLELLKLARTHELQSVVYDHENMM